MCFIRGRASRLSKQKDDKETEESKLSRFDSYSYSHIKMLHLSHKYGQLLLQAHQQGFYFILFYFERTLKKSQGNGVMEVFSEFSLL